MNRVRGFTLIEIAVALFIIALLGGAIAHYLAGQVTAAKQALTQTRQAAIKTALTNFIARNNRLPCPAIAAIASGNLGDGVEAPTPGTCTGTNLSAGVSTGVIPWVSLGLSSEAALDGYSNRFTYQVTLTATGLAAPTVMGMKGAISIHSAGLGTLGSPSATIPGNQLNDCRTDMTVAYVASANPCAAAAVIVSHGADGYGAFTDGGVQIGFPAAVTGSDAVENANADSKFVMKPYSGISSNPFDDIVLALTPNDLISGLTSTGGMQSAIAALNANFNLIKSALIVYAFQNRTGAFSCAMGTCPATTNCPGVPMTNPTCETTTFSFPVLPPDGINVIPAILALPATVTTDPWGSAIKYEQMTATITTATLASAVAFKLTSAGPDGSFAVTNDDLSTTVYVGEVKTQFSKY
jgi:prepilin-type N-terminal cleavage/methylation domain-containing protein